MANQDKNDDKKSQEDLKNKAYSSGSGSQDSNEEAKKQAIAKMKLAQAEVRMSDDYEDESGIAVTEGDIDPKAQKALRDLMGKVQKKGSSVLKQVKVYTPFRIYYDSEASSVSAVNGTGPFDVLPGHKNFLSLLSPGDIVVRSASGKEERITIERGVMHVNDDTVKVFLDV